MGSFDFWSYYDYYGMLDTEWKTIQVEWSKKKKV